MPSRFIEAAEQLDRLAIVLDGCARQGQAVSADAAGCIADGLKSAAKLIRIGERQRLAALQVAGNPVEDGLTVVLTPFSVVQGGRA